MSEANEVRSVEQKLYQLPENLIENAALAQLVEQGTENPCVLGSIPRCGTTLKKPKRLLFSSPGILGIEPYNLFSQVITCSVRDAAPLLKRTLLGSFLLKFYTKK